MDWQPIETVPPDIEVIVACEYGVCTAICESGQWWYLQAGGCQPTTLYGDSYSVQWPTHWAPLPDAPASAIEARRVETERLDAKHESAVPEGQTP